LKLRDLYKGYKQLDKSPDEIVTSVRFKLPGKNTRFNFEKVSKRTYLDIASVNTAIRLEMDGDTIREAHVSAGGVAPIPKYLANTSCLSCGQADRQHETARSDQGDERRDRADQRCARHCGLQAVATAPVVLRALPRLFPERFTLKELVA
jgi:xanthine dehydrogenase iron-sulfur cluster and FAD-binding subunit A